MYDDVPEYIKNFLMYMKNIQNRSKNTVKEYYYDLRNAFRFFKADFNNLDKNNLNEIDITNIDINFIKKIKLNDLYNYLDFLSNNSDKVSTRSRKVSSLKSFFNYLCFKERALEINPTVELEMPRLEKRNPKYLTLDESLSLLHSVDGKFEKRDYAILTLFLNCGLRLSELVNINIKDIKGTSLNVIGKGNKERNLYLNDACKSAIDDYIKVRPKDNLKDRDALFISSFGKRISNRMVEMIVKKYVIQAGLDPRKYSPHKLRHTAATLMLKYGKVDIRSLQQVLGHESISTTELYTHVDNEQVKDALSKNPLNKKNI